jgi:hypothetical protein
VGCACAATGAPQAAQKVPFSGICAPHFSQKAINFYRPFAQIPAVDMPPPFRCASIFIVETKNPVFSMAE